MQSQSEFQGFINSFNAFRNEKTEIVNILERQTE